MTESIELLANNQIHFTSLVKLCPDMKSPVKWFQQNNILSSPHICSQGHEMNLQLSEKILDSDFEKGLYRILRLTKRHFCGKHPSAI